MDITPYVENLRRDLLAAADAGGPDAREATERLAFALDPAARLALMEAVSQAAAEITAEMPTGSVEVRLSGRELDFVVDATPPETLASPPSPTPPGADDAADDGSVSRVTLRIPEAVKLRAEEMAARSGHSLNTWLVTVVRAATRDGAVSADLDLSSIPFSSGIEPYGGGKRGTKRMSGWV